MYFLEIFSGVCNSETLDMANWGNRNGRSKGENLVNCRVCLCLGAIGVMTNFDWLTCLIYMSTSLLNPNTHQGKRRKNLVLS